jgi:hypothetical protein
MNDVDIDEMSVEVARPARRPDEPAPEQKERRDVDPAALRRAQELLAARRARLIAF